MRQRVIFPRNLMTEIATAISECEHDRVFVLTDETTARHCWPQLRDKPALRDAHLITIPATDAHKDLTSLSLVWQALQQGGATRHSCLINLGGGMVTDLGGFAASTFKRGIDFINIPTTLLAMVDASVGGKTGINFGGLKNELGVFSEAHSVILDTHFLQTLDRENLLSGYAEMLKHGLISDEAHWAELLQTDASQPDLDHLQALLKRSVTIKQHFVEQDPTERGLRKALNFGHTVGHAFESFSLKASRHEGQPQGSLLHGYAVAFGMICELYLSAIRMGFPTDKLRQTVAYIREHYGHYDILCSHYDELIELMRHDKKNTAGRINFTLLSDIGQLHINQTVTDDQIREALDFFREG